MLCSERSLVKHSLAGITVSCLFCRSWGCEICGPRRAARVARELKHGRPTKFLTLTVNPARSISPEQRARELLRAFKAWIAKLRRAHPGQECEYGWVVEKTSAGEPHLHVLGRWPYVPQRDISAFFAKRLKAPIIDIRKPRSRDGLSRYLSKYLSKDPEKFGTMKRYGFSKAYRADLEPRLPLAPEWRGNWAQVDRPYLDLFLHYVTQGWEISDNARLGFFEARPPPDRSRGKFSYDPTFRQRS